MTEVKFKNRKLNTQKLLSFGFENAGNDYTYHTELADSQIKLTIKIDHEEAIEKEVDGVKILPGYHMNKKHWITICLDSSMSMDEICGRIDESYLLAKK